MSHSFLFFITLSSPFFTIHDEEGENLKQGLEEIITDIYPKHFNGFTPKIQQPHRSSIFIPPKSFKRNQNRLYLHHY